MRATEALTARVAPAVGCSAGGAVPPRAQHRVARGSRRHLAAWAVTLALAGASCATPAPLSRDATDLYRRALAQFTGHSIRLQTIAQRIQIANRELCGDELAPVLGVVALRAVDLPRDLRAIGRAQLGRGPSPVVVGLVASSAAARAGVAVGDQILSIGRTAARGPASIYAPARVRADTVAMRVRRGAETRTIEVANDEGCRFFSELVDSEGFNAYATGAQIVVYTGMMRILDRDPSLAFVLGHELAHDIVYAREGRRARDAADEGRADHLGAYLAERGGYQLEPRDFGLARAAALPDRELGASTTHPAAPARLAAFERTLREIADRRAAGATMLPDSF